MIVARRCTHVFIWQDAQGHVARALAPVFVFAARKKEQTNIHHQLTPSTSPSRPKALRNATSIEAVNRSRACMHGVP